MAVPPDQGTPFAGHDEASSLDSLSVSGRKVAKEEARFRPPVFFVADVAVERTVAEVKEQRPTVPVESSFETETKVTCHVDLNSVRGMVETYWVKDSEW